MLNKEDIYVIVDTPKKEKKLTKILEKFGETIFTRPDHKNISHNGKDLLGWAYGYSSGSWQGINTRFVGHNGKSFTEVSVKQLKTILKSERTKREVEDILGELESQKHEVPNIEFELTPDDYKNNTWYKSKEPGPIFFLEKGEKNYGFYPEYSDEIEWFSNFRANGFHLVGNWTEAKPEEVEEILISEAKRRGLVEGVKITSPWISGGDKSLTKLTDAYRWRGNALISIGSVSYTLFNYGKWATPVDPFAELKEAHKNGKVIQFKHHTDGWVDLKDPKFNDTFSLYRIKPEEEFKLNRTTFCSKETKILINHFRPESVEIGCYFREQKAFHTFTDKQQLVQFIGVLKNIADKM